MLINLSYEGSWSCDLNITKNDILFGVLPQGTKFQEIIHKFLLSSLMENAHIVLKEDLQMKQYREQYKFWRSKSSIFVFVSFSQNVCTLKEYAIKTWFL